MYTTNTFEWVLDEIGFHGTLLTYKIPLFGLKILRNQHAIHYHLCRHSKLSFKWNVRAFLCIMALKHIFWEKKKMRNTILICYCCFNLRLLSILAHFAQTFYSILFLSYGIVRAFVYMCRCIRTLTQREIEEKKRSFILFIQVK